MKATDILPSDRTPRKLKVPEVMLFRYTPTLKDELDKGIITRAEALRLFRAMMLHRNVEYMVRDLDVKRFVPYEGYEYRGTSHLSVGQEAAAVGAMSMLRCEDYITSTHRGHGHCVNKGLFALQEMDEASLKRFTKDAEKNEFPIKDYKDLREAAIDYHVYRTMAELLGKQAGYCKGRGGGMHIADFSVGNLGANAIVGGSFAIATGAAFASDHLGEGRVVVCCIGDGAMNNGIAHEAMNFSTLGQFEHGLPVIFFVENNQYGYTGQQKIEATDIEFLSQRGLGYNAEGMHAETICGMNVLSVRDALKRAKELCLKGEGPVLIEAETYRHWGHNFKDKGTSYRTDAEKEAWLKYDPVDWFKAQLIENKILTAESAEKEWNQAREKVEIATRRAINGKDPDPKDMFDGLFACSTSDNIGDKYKTINMLKEARSIPRDSEGKIMTRHAVVEALTEEMIRDRRVCVWGEDVAEQGGAYVATSGLLEIFGRKRVFNSPISESAIVGTAVGAAMAGLRPVVELMYIDFVLQAMDQLGNQAAKARYMFGGQYTIPMVVRATIGGGKGYAGQHSQSLESVPAHFPGLRVIAPSNAYDMKGLLKSAIRDDNPVFFIEHQWVYLEKSVVPLEDYTVPIGVGKVVKEGSDITVVCYSNMVPRVLAAAKKLEAEDGIKVEVVDPRTLVPLDIDLISSSVKKTGHAMIVVQAVYTGGYASHISHEITRTSFKELKEPVRILSAYDVPPPMAYPLEVENIPSVDKIIRTIKEELKVKGARK
ncbi:MAG: dehydrogenase E1 component subunit alpha/beta [Spirochaetia bacterium]|jgi:2-oxoisovalerate dehydrogenase E1 component